jgi:hypothetical protein
MLENKACPEYVKGTTYFWICHLLMELIIIFKVIELA